MFQDHIVKSVDIFFEWIRVRILQTGMWSWGGAASLSPPARSLGERRTFSQ